MNNVSYDRQLLIHNVKLIAPIQFTYPQIASYKENQEVKRVKNFLIARLYGVTCLIYTGVISVTGLKSLCSPLIVRLLRRLARYFKSRIYFPYKINCITSTHSLPPNLKPNFDNLIFSDKFICSHERQVFGGMQIRLKIYKSFVYQYFGLHNRIVCIGSTNYKNLINAITQIEQTLFASPRYSF